MILDDRFDVATSQWAAAYRHACAYCMYILGADQQQSHADLLASVHRALVDEEDPTDLLARLSDPAERADFEDLTISLAPSR